MHQFISGTVNIFNNISQVSPLCLVLKRGRNMFIKLEEKKSNEMLYNFTQVKFIDPHFPVSSQSHCALTRYFGAC